jgi:hypothetical protein
MLQAHSLLWHFLFVAPNLFLLALAVVLCRRKLQKRIPIFIAFAFIMALEQLAVYAADVSPAVSPTTFWNVFWVGLLIEAIFKFALMGEIFGLVLGLYPALARLGKLLISAVGVLLVFVAAVVAAYTPKDNVYWIVSGAHVLEQTIYIIESGLILFLFAFAAFFKLPWARASFGIALGLGLSACVHLAVWALAAGANLSPHVRSFLDFPLMASYNVSVLVWFYYLLAPEKSPVPQAEILVPGNNLDIWNRELERLLHQ